MTTTVVVDKNSTVTIRDQSVNTVVVRDETPRTVITGIMGPPGKTTINALEDVNISQLTTGSILVYNSQTQTWTSTTLLNQQIVDSGQY
jgi:hypothetical protein